MKDRGLIRYSFAAILYLFAVATIGFLYSFFAMPAVYYQSNSIFAILIAIASFIPYLLLGTVLGVVTKYPERSSAFRQTYSPFRTISFWTLILSVALIVFAFTLSTSEFADRSNTMGSGKGILEFIGLWLGGITSGWFVFQWLNTAVRSFHDHRSAAYPTTD